MTKLFETPWHDLGLTYGQALHGVQSAVKHEINIQPRDPDPRFDTSSASPKHLRTGVNSAMVEHSALATLLMRKGIITEDEYREELRLAANHELWRYEEIHKPIKFR